MRTWFFVKWFMLYLMSTLVTEEYVYNFERNRSLQTDLILKEILSTADLQQLNILLSSNSNNNKLITLF